MRSVLARTLLPLLALAGVACEDGEAPTGGPSAFEVFVYVEVDDSTGMGEADVPVSATVTVASDFDDFVATDETGPDGRVRFEDIQPGAYTVSHVVTDQPPGSELVGSTAQTVVAGFAGDTVVDTRFIYRFQPGSLAGVVFRDDDGSGGFDAGLDSTFAGVAVLAFAGADTVGTPAGADTTGADGLWSIGGLDAGEYLVLVRPLAGTAVVGPNPRPATIEAGAETSLDIELSGDPTGPVITVAEARAAEEDSAVKVRGVVTAGQGTYRNDAFYMQDATAGILVFGVDSALALARGDSVQVFGSRATGSRQEVQIAVTSVVRLGTGTLPDPRVVTTSDVDAGLFQGELATLSATVDSVGEPAGGGYAVYVRDAVDESLVFVDADTGIEADVFPVDSIRSVTGVLSVLDADDDGTLEDGDYRLMPRDSADVD